MWCFSWFALFFCYCDRWYKCRQYVSVSQIAKFMGGQHGTHLSPVGPRWTPCWPHKPITMFGGSAARWSENLFSVRCRFISISLYALSLCRYPQVEGVCLKFIFIFLNGTLMLGADGGYLNKMVLSTCCILWGRAFFNIRCVCLYQQLKLL